MPSAPWVSTGARRLWAVQALKDPALPLFEHAEAAAARAPTCRRSRARTSPGSSCRRWRLGEHVIEDYATLRMSLKAHPLALLRDGSPPAVTTARELWQYRPGRRVTVGGLVLVRQRPGSAKGVIFTTLEDETGFANCIVWPAVFERTAPSS